MSARYTALPSENSRAKNVLDIGDEDEMEAAFAGSDEEEEDYDNSLHHHDAESRPLNPKIISTPTSTGPPDSLDHPLSHNQSSNYSHQRTYSVGGLNTRTTGGIPEYDFERTDYDFPPPGSPPRGDRALPDNDWGNSNGLLPLSPIAPAFPPRRGSSRLPAWARHAMASIIPFHFSPPLTTNPSRSSRVVGGGLMNDGVFANVTAKPTAHTERATENEGVDSIYTQPEFAQKDAPPSYAAAQQDAVPPYWETTILAPSSHANYSSLQPGEVPIDGLPAGTVFAFLWNALVSISFQFVGFLLTYFLHSSHAARLGARAGLGVTLIQYGFALRAGRDGDWENGSNGGYGGGSPFDEDSAPSPVPTFSSAADADSWYSSQNSTDMGMMPTGAPAPDSSGYGSIVMNDLTTEWLAFLLMTIGWFILLNSLLGFWRIKRWERSLLASHTPSSSNNSSSQPNGQSPDTSSSDSSASPAVPTSLSAHLERTLGLRVPNVRMLRLGLGLPTFGTPPGASSRIRNEPHEADLERGESGDTTEDGSFDPFIFEYTRDASFDEDEDLDLVRTRARSGGISGVDVDASAPLLVNVPEDHPARARFIAEAYASERRLQNDLRAAGLL